MNRLASLLAGGVTAAVSGAVIAAAAVGQGVFDSPSKPQPKQDEVAATSTWSSDPTAAAAQQPAVQAVQPRIVYVDKDPVVVTQTYQQPVAGSAALSTETASPTPPPTRTPTVAAPPKAGAMPAAEPSDSGPRIQQLPPAAGNAPVAANPTETPQITAPTTTAPTQPPAAATTSTRPRDDDHRTTTTTGGEHERD